MHYAIGHMRVHAEHNYMNDQTRQLARAVVWASTQHEVAAAQARLWQAVAPDMDTYHLALWEAGLEKMDYLRWERNNRRAQTSHWQAR
jgi:hypothetical protein